MGVPVQTNTSIYYQDDEVFFAGASQIDGMILCQCYAVFIKSQYIRYSRKKQYYVIPISFHYVYHTVFIL